MPAPPVTTEDQKQAIPKASVRPQLRETGGKGGGSGKRKATSTAVRGGAQVKREKVEEEEEETAGTSRVGVAGKKDCKVEKEGFTSTVCVNFSADDLRLATIPGQEEDFDPATRCNKN